MRLPRDTTLVVMSEQLAIDPVPQDAVEERVAAVLTAWRAAGLPIIHSQGKRAETNRANDVRMRPLSNERIVAKSNDDAFLDSDLEKVLTEDGVTTLVLCGRHVEMAGQATVRHACRLGFRTFVIADASSGNEAMAVRIDQIDESGNRAVSVDATTAIAAARLAAR